MTALQHPLQSLHEVPILQRSRHPLLIQQLPGDRFGRTMCSFLDLHIDPKPWRKGLLEANAHAKTDDGGKRAVGDCRRDQHGEDGNILCIS